MLGFFRKQMRALQAGTPGHRFRDRYHSAQRNKTSRSLLSRLVRWSMAAIFFAIAVVLVFIPGPAILFFFLTGAMLAADSLWIARSLDWIEVKGRALWRWAKGHWKKLSLPVKCSLVSSVALLGAASAIGVYLLMFR